MMRIGLIGTNNTHGHQLAGFINGWRPDVPIPSRWVHGPLPQFYLWAKTLRELEETGRVPAPDARVTRLWSEDPATEGALIARACEVERLVDSPEEATRDVDAVLLLTDDPNSHVDLAVPVLKAGLPMFIDKPLAPTDDAAREMAEVASASGTPWFSGSAFRFSPSLLAFRDRVTAEIGVPTAVYVQCPGWIERYGIHALEIMNVLVGHWVSEVAGAALPGRSSASLLLEGGETVLLETMSTAFDPPAQAIVWGAHGSLHWESRDVYRSIFSMTTAFLDMARSGVAPVPEAESLELARLANVLAEAASAKA
ncbi:Gfo/Idh/MocA family oxidoreductase [Phytoactinopolyspora alkaliphila]|uniref:Gfo/Idh/MocA family oxidoreductase n=1 Tax=Phytoactinopolyspora alkaliphila TaxID=1783498 RepID=A0A6N9YU72_9ACTN|nr:Gfo/Idh/MocA family oxidoreductase [Phytoactinopolyspora alkaliphila]NED98542.1 Gfo/Idh/MocA family oxidoreductase [Phytoactinopolyspora alkaliphila]